MHESRVVPSTPIFSAQALVMISVPRGSVSRWAMARKATVFGLGL